MASQVKSKTAVVTLIVNGKSAEANIKDFGAALRSVNKELRGMSASDPNFQKRLEEKRMITGEYLKQKAAIGDVRTGWQKFMSEAGKVGSGLVGANLFQMALSLIYTSIIKLINITGKLSDELANIAKTTGLSTSEVKELNGELAKLDTRTSMENLRKLAEEAGRLGYTGKEDIMEFVKAADMINVALGDSLGEGATKDIAKISDIFKLKEIYGVEGAMLRVGSAINEIGMASTANEGYIVDFLKRMSGISGIANVSVQELIALGGTLDSLGQTSEVSSTSLSKLLVKMGSDVKTYAKLAGVSMEEFRVTMNRSAVEGLMLVLKQVGRTTGGIEQLSATLGDLGLDGGRVVGVLGTLAKNTDEYSRQLGISTTAMEKNVSITNEFNIQNQTTGAILDKIGKSFVKMWEGGSNALAPYVLGFAKLIGAVDTMDLKLQELNAQQNKVLAAEAKFPALLSRYDELKLKGKLSAVEQEELRKIIDQITEHVPNAATSFDKYGKALDLNKDKVLAFITEQRGLLEAMRQTRREMLKEKIADLEKEVQPLLAKLNRGGVQLGGNHAFQAYSDEKKNEMRKELAQMQADLKAHKADLDGVNGIVKPVKVAKTGPTAETVEEKKARLEAEKQERERKNAQNKETLKRAAEARKQLNDELLKDRQRVTLETMEGQARELQDVQNHYDELQAKAKGNATALQEVEALRAIKIGQVNDKYQKKYFADFDKTIRGQLDLMNQASKEQDEYEMKRIDEASKRRDKQLFEITDHYAKEIAMAKSRGESIAQLEKDRDAEIATLQADRITKSNNDMLENIANSYQNEMALAEQQHLSKVQVISDHLEQLRLVKANYANLDIEQQKKVNSEIALSEQQLLQARLDNYDRVGTAMKAGGEAIFGILSMTAKNQGEYAEFQQALALFTIAVDAGVAIAGAVTAATHGDGYTFVLRLAAAVAAVGSAIATAKKMAMSEEKPSTPTFATGGYSDIHELNNRTGGYFGRSTLFRGNGREYIAGEAGKEFIISNNALQYPRVAAFADMIDSVQKTKNWTSLNNPTQPATPVRDNDNQFMIGPADKAHQRRIEDLLRDIRDKNQGLNYSVLEEYEKALKNIRQRASA